MHEKETVSSQDLVSLNSKDSLEQVQGSETYFGQLKMGLMSRDFKPNFGEGEDVKLANTKLVNGQISYSDTSFAVLMGIEIPSDHKLKKGEKIAIIPENLNPGDSRKVSIIPYEWHQKAFEEYQRSGILPIGVVVISVPKELVSEEKKPVVRGGLERFRLIKQRLLSLFD